MNAFLYRFSLCPTFFDFFVGIGTSFWLRIPLFVTYAAGYAQYLIHFTICLNRLTAVVLIKGYTRVGARGFNGGARAHCVGGGRTRIFCSIAE